MKSRSNSFDLIDTQLPAMDTEPAQLATWIEAHGPPGTVVAADRIAPGRAFDAAEEREVAHAVANRRDEFATGRRLARAALGRLGCEPTGIPAGADRAPIWPEGFLGTISHAGRLCVVHVGRTRDLTGMGVDIASKSRLEPALLKDICRPDERAFDETGGTIDPVMLRFVSKEAFFKAYYPATRAFLEFHDVRVEIDPKHGIFEARLMDPNKPALGEARAFVGRFECFGSHLAAALWIKR